MSDKKQFGVWMDGHHAAVVGKGNSGEYVVHAHLKNEETPGNSSENAANNHEVTLRHKFFKDIASHMQNAEQVHVTGTGVAQEQFISYLKDMPQFKDIKATECTSNKMSEEKLLEFFEEKFN